MNHLGELQLSELLDRTTETSPASEQSDHLNECPHCQAQLAALSRENALIATALNREADAYAATIDIPTFTPPASLSRFAMINLSTALVIWLAQFLWKTLFGELIVNAATTITSVYVPDLYAAANTTFLHYLKEGTTMLDTYLGFVLFGLCLLTLIWALAKFRSHRAVVSLCLLTTVSLTLLTPAPASALEIRREDDGVITIPADEAIDDSLLAAAETILVKGKVSGDLIAAGRRVEIDGSVAGNLITFAEIITIRGTVGGTVITAGSQVELVGGRIEGDMWAAARNLRMDAKSNIAHNLLATAESVALAGSVANELHSFAETLELNGELGGNLHASGRQVRLLESSVIKGNAILRVPAEDALQRSATAQLLGGLEMDEKRFNKHDRGHRGGGKFYLWQMARLISALLVGLALFWYMPALKHLSLPGGLDGLKTTGFGLAIVIAVPILAVLLIITLVGIPLASIVLLLWLLLLYCAKIIIGAYLGRSVLVRTNARDNDLLVLLVGLALVIIATNIPLIGGTLNLLMTIAGTGLIMQQLMHQYAKARFE